MPTLSELLENPKNDGKLLPLNQKAINSIVYTEYLNVWEGTVRSGKTVCSLIAFYLYVYFCPDNYFIMSGQTVGSLYKNCIGGDFGLLNLFLGLISYKNDVNGNRTLYLIGKDGQKKTIYCYGAHDEASYKSMRGLTAAGWYADEIDLQPRSFVEEAFRRTIVSKQRKIFWTLNPTNPYHWIYTDYIDKYTNENLKGFWLWFFKLSDNPALTEERIKEMAAQYSGIFYRRYILGERCVAEGAIYSMFDDKNIYDSPFNFNEKYYNRYIAIDYGTTNPCVFLDIYDDGNKTYIDREYYWDSRKQMKQKTDEEYVDDLKNFINEVTAYYKPIIYIDPSAESFEVAMKKKGIFVRQAINEVENGIRRVSTLIGNKTLLVNRKCVNTIKEIYSYSWNDKKAIEQGKEEPIKQNDHSCDAIRYFVNTAIARWRVGEMGSK